MLLCSNVYFYHSSFILRRSIDLYQVFVTIGDSFTTLEKIV